MIRTETTGMVVSSTSIEWTTLRKEKDKLVQTASGKIDLTPAAPVEGDASQAGQAQGTANAEAISAQLSKIRGDVVVAIPSDQLLLRTVQLPAVSAAELADIVQLQVDKFSPFPVESMVSSFEVIHEAADKELVAIAAARQEVIENAGSLLKPAGIVPHRVDAAVMGWCRVLKDAGMAGRSHGFEIVVLMIGRVLEIVTFNDGRPLIFHTLTHEEGASEQEAAEELVSTINQTLMTIELEHGGGTDCSVTVYHDAPIQSATAAALRQGCPCEVVIHPLEGVPSPSEGIARREAENAGGIFDLTPPAWRAAEKTRLFRKRLLFGTIAVFGAWLIAAAGLVGAFYAEEFRVSSLRSRKEELSKPAREVAHLRNRIRLVRIYMDRSKSALECLRQISLILPQGVDLTSFSYRKGEAAKITGEAETVNLIYDFKNKLDESNFFAETAIDGGVRKEPRTGRQVFGMDLKLAAGGNAE